MQKKENKKMMGILSLIVAVIIIGVGINTMFNSKKKYTYVNTKGDKFTEVQLSQIKVNNMRIKNDDLQLQQDANKHVGTLTNQAVKDMNAYVPSIKDDSATNILGLQQQLLSNLQQDITAN